MVDEFDKVGGNLVNGVDGDLNGSVEQVIVQFFDDYQVGFNDYDIEWICDCFVLFIIIWQYDKGYVFNDDEELIENIEVFLRVLEKEGVSYFEFQVVFSYVSGFLVLVILDWIQEDVDGELVFEFICYYQLFQDGMDWMIVGIVNE